MRIDPRKPDYTDTPAGTGRSGFSYRPRSLSDCALRPLVSIVTPFYNTGDVFHETARSVFGQSLQCFEWIIINDRSTDPAALAVLDWYRCRDPRIRVIDLPENSGPSRARNAGFEAARSEYVYQLDSDDLLEPTALEKCLWFLARHPEYAFANTCEVGFGALEYLWNLGFHNPDRFLSDCPVGSHTVMVRKSAHAEVGGYDESIRGGMEDWEFWLRSADKGKWGVTVPEHLAWYRRREGHNQSWADWDGGERQRKFNERLREKYSRLFEGPHQFPQIPPRWHLPYESFEPTPPFSNPLAKAAPRALLVIPWVRMGGADKFNLDLCDQLIAKGYELTIACTVQAQHTWLPEFARRTPDIFLLHNYARVPDHPLFLRYLIESRDVDTVIVSNSELGYLSLPWLRAVCPKPTYVDYVHMEEPYWKCGGHARYSATHSAQLDYTMVTSEHLKRWIVDRGGEPDRTGVVYINVDPRAFEPDPDTRAAVRRELQVDDETPIILYAARLTRQKQPAVFAATMRELVDRGVDFRAVVAGDGEERAALEALLEQHKLRHHVTMLGETTADRVRELLQAADIFFLPSLWEGIALVLYEAMAAGVPFVGANVGGQAELATPDCAVMIEKPASVSEEPKIYAAELASLLQDAGRRRAMGRCAAARIRSQFTLSRMGEAFVAGLARAEELRRTSPRPTLPEPYARELATHATELMRLNVLADWLWVERERLLHERAANSSLIEPALSGIPPAPSAVHEELARIENSRSFRFVRSLKATAAYRLFARLRYGAAWNQTGEHADRPEDPGVRLARLKASRAYRLVAAAKKSPIYRAYARRRYGPGWEDHAPGL